MSDAPFLHNEALSCGFSPQLEQTFTYFSSCAWIRQCVLETGAPDAMLNKLEEEGIKSIKDLEFMS